jgi:ActR/RegA family two-component response regulator
MPQVSKNLLVVEDDQEWCENYVRAAKTEGFDSIKIAQNLRQAEALIDQMQFAVAFIDIGLNITDDRNVDGIRVMGKIRDSGDQTSIIVVTGRSGRDVLPIARNVLKEYNALDIVGKADAKPQEIRDLLRVGLGEFIEKNAAEGVTAEDVLRGGTPRLHWDSQMLKATDVQNGVQGLRNFLATLLGEFLPLVASNESEPVTLDSTNGLAHGIYWSRATGRAVVVFYGRRSAAGGVVDEAKSSGLLLGRYHVDKLLTRSSAHGLTGAVFALQDTPRESFGALR